MRPYWAGRAPLLGGPCAPTGRTMRPYWADHAPPTGQTVHPYWAGRVAVLVGGGSADRVTETVGGPVGVGVTVGSGRVGDRVYVGGLVGVGLPGSLTSNGPTRPRIRLRATTAENTYKVTWVIRLLDRRVIRQQPPL